MVNLIPGIGAGSLLDAEFLANDRATRIGAIQKLDYHEAIVLTHDRWKFDCGGIPQFSFLIATARDISDAGGRTDDDEVLLLRVEGTASLSLDSDLHAVREEALREALSKNNNPSPSVVLDVDIDPFTRNRASFTGLKCKVLGTFYEEDIDGTRTLQFGSDVDNFYATSSYRVLKPTGKGLSAIASFLKPGSGEVERMQLGTVRYSATRRRSIAAGQAESAVTVNIRDFIGHKTGLLGMTRSGKSNTAKILVARTFATSETRRAEGLPPIGQLIFDPQGEYANANTQDGTAIAAIGDKHVRIYKFGADASKAHVRPLGINFFDPDQIELVQDFVVAELRQQDSSGYVNDFANADFTDGDGARQTLARASRGRFILYASFLKAAFAPPAGFRAQLTINKDLKAEVITELGSDPFTSAGGPGSYFVAGGDVIGVVETINKLRDAGSTFATEFTNDDRWRNTEPIFSGQSGSRQVRGFRNLIPLREFHNKDTKRSVAKEIYEDLLTGKIVIVDLHIGSSAATKRLSESITQYILRKHTETFTSGAEPEPIQVMLEEAHNLFSSKVYDNDGDVWVRLAKEASKLNIGMIYATQEVSGVAHQVKANTANWVVSHLNNHTELNELGKFYDFRSYADAILASEDRGYVRLKTLSSPYIVPVQVERYDRGLVNLARAAAGEAPLPETDGTD